MDNGQNQVIIYVKVPKSTEYQRHRIETAVDFSTPYMQAIALSARSMQSKVFYATASRGFAATKTYLYVSVKLR